MTTKRFGNAVPERVCFTEAQELANQSGKRLWGYFDDDGSYVVTEESQDDKEHGYHEVYEPRAVDAV